MVVCLCCMQLLILVITTVLTSVPGEHSYTQKYQNSNIGTVISMCKKLC